MAALTPRTRLRGLAPYAVLAAAWAALIAYAHPGLMSWDSIRQLDEARSHIYGNWHPPMMAALWGVLDAIVRGPLLMLALQVALAIVGLYGILRHYFAPLRAAVIAAGVFWFPPVMSIFAVIWKDSLMEGCVLCGVAGLLATNRYARAAGWLALFGAAAVRHNAPVIIIPIAAILMYGSARPWRRHVLGAAIGLGISVVAGLANRTLATKDEHPFASMIAIADLAGILDEAPDLDDATVRELLAGTPLVTTSNIQARARKLVPDTPGNMEDVTTGTLRLFDLPTTDAQSDALVAAWWRGIASYPFDYLGYRLRVFRSALGLVGRPRPFFTPLDESAHLLGVVGEKRDYDRYQLAIAHGLHAISRWVLFWPFLYVILGAGLLVILWRDRVVRALLASAFLYEAGLLVLAPGGQEWRYSHWLVTCTVIAVAVRLLGLQRSATSTAAQSPVNSTPRAPTA